MACATLTSAQRFQALVRVNMRDKARRGDQQPRPTIRPKIIGQTDNAGAAQAPRGQPRAVRQATQQASITAPGARNITTGCCSPLASTVPAVSTLHTALRLFVSPGTTWACDHEASPPGILTTTLADRALQLGTCSLQQGALCTAPTRTRVRGRCAYLSRGFEEFNAGLHTSEDALRCAHCLRLRQKLPVALT